MMNKINSFAEYTTAYNKSVENPEAFWAEIASTFLWKSKWDKVLDWEFNTPDVNWFVSGKLNITENCLDRHLEKKGSDIAIIWEPNDPSEKSWCNIGTTVHFKPSILPLITDDFGLKTDHHLLWIPHFETSTNP